MGLRPTHRNESALLRFIDSKQVTRDFRGSAMGIYRQLTPPQKGTNRLLCDKPFPFSRAIPSHLWLASPSRNRRCSLR
jgi:hypothetical protein